MKKINTNGQRCSYSLKLREYTLFVCILFVVSLTSCSDNPVTPEPPPPSAEIIDSNFFDWEYFDVFGTNLGAIYAIDTNDILILGSPSSVRFRDRKIEFTNLGDPDFQPRALNGIGNTVFIGGRSLSQNTIKLKKLEGDNFIEVELNDTTASTIAFIYPNFESNDMWFLANTRDSGRYRYLYRYHNNQLTKYFENDDPRIFSIDLNRSAQNEITAILHISLELPNFILVYKKFENPNWIEVGRDTVTSSSLLRYTMGYDGIGRVLRSGRNGYIYKFSDNYEWVENINTFNVWLSGVPDFAMGNENGGYIINGRTGGGNALPQPFPVLYYYNGQIYFQSEHGVPHTNEPIHRLSYRFDRYYFVYTNFHIFESKFSIGIPKNKPNQNENNYFNHDFTLIE